MRAADGEPHDMKPLPKIAWILGYAGVLPFFILTLALWLDKPLPLLGQVRLDWWLVAYAAIILTFISAVHWGAALGNQNRLAIQDSKASFIYSVIPPALAWFTLLLPVKFALAVLGVLILFAYLADRMFLFPMLNSNYPKLRLNLTLMVTPLLFIAAAII